MSSIREGMTQFLNARVAESPYLIPKWSQDLESQVLVHEGSNAIGETTWTDGSEVWFQHRWPYKAGTAPFYKDKPLTFSPGTHLRRFGSTWWNYKAKRSVAVALDIDLEDEHAKSTTTVTPAQLSELIGKLGKLDYLTLVRSSGGGGVHIYCFFDENDQPEAANHNEHTQVAKALIAKISDDIGYDLNQHMDAKGVVFWLWSCDSPADHAGYELIKEQTQSLGSKDLEGYRSAGLASPNASKKMRGFTDSGEEVESTEVGGGYKEYDLEPWHTQFLKDLEDEGYGFHWEAAYKMAHTHTCAILAVLEKYKAAGKPAKGLFTTVSKGNDKTKPNCYITPRPGGVFQCKRFGTATAETALWQTRDDDTWCFINTETPVLIVLKKFATSYDGTKMVFEPSRLEEAMQVFGHTLGPSHLNIPEAIRVHLKKDGTFYAAFKGTGNFEGWKAGKEQFTRTLPLTHKKATFDKSLLEEADDFVRHIVTPNHDPYGWALKTADAWVTYKSYDSIAVIVRQAFGKDADSVKVEMMKNPWILHHLPFGPEYPEGRLWNKIAPQLKYEPAEKPAPHPHWDMIFTHLGRSLDATVAKTQWCQRWGIHTGADYLRAWVVAMIKEPFQQLPYLFFYGPQNSGKSQFHESIAMLLTRGVESIGTALASGAGYNAEIANAVVGFVEEKDLSVVRDTSYARIKEWSTARMMQIHPKGHTPYQQKNSLHMVHMANHSTACPMEDGDTRITAVLVSPIEALIPKQQFEEALEAEAPAFIRTLLTINLPKSHERYRVPMLATEHKRDLEEINQSPFEEFCNGVLYPCRGHSICVKDLYEMYEGHCQRAGVPTPKLKSIKQLLKNRSDKYLLGKDRTNRDAIGNVSFKSNAEPKPKAYGLTKKGGLKYV
jgi:hypothetical protein